MLGLRQKMSLGFGGMLAILVIIGVQSVRHFTSLGVSIDVILRENYRSVIACQRMNEALERMDREEAMGAIKLAIDTGIQFRAPGAFFLNTMVV